MMSHLNTLSSNLLLLMVFSSMQGCYLTQQAYYQNNLLNSRQPVAFVERDPDLSSADRRKLQLLGKVKAYAALHGLSSEGAYDSYVDNGKGAMSYLVFAAPIDQLQAKTWWFPIVGSVPYLGYFRKQDREDKAADLADEGLDIYKSRSMAFSSLGYFDDPVYSSQFQYTDRSFSHTIFHELVHRTVWVPGSTRFNENLAEFIADKLTSRFYGQHIPKVEGLLTKRVQRKRQFIAFVDEAKERLGDYYQDPSRPKPRQSAAERQRFLDERKKILAEVVKKYYNPSGSGYQQAMASRSWNNASLLAASLYLPDYEIFAKAYACTGSEVPKFVTALKTAVATAPASGQPPEDILATLCQGSTSLP